MGHAVADAGTAGLSPVHGRIAETGVVSLDESGESEDEWQSLINPLCGVGAVFVHGLTDADVADAPTLVDLLPQARGLFSGRVPVAYNAMLGIGFLNASFARVGYSMYVPRETTVCAMELSGIYLPSRRHRLAAAAERADVATAKRHRAPADTHTAVGLLRHYSNAEANRVRYAERTFSRSGETVEPTVWIEVRGAAVGPSWPDFLF